MRPHELERPRRVEHVITRERNMHPPPERNGHDLLHEPDKRSDVVLGDFAFDLVHLRHSDGKKFCFNLRCQQGNIHLFDHQSITKSAECCKFDFDKRARKVVVAKESYEVFRLIPGITR